MPPRYAYWTILVDNVPTAFRAREVEELLPTLNQLKRKNANAEMRWFARGRLWESREQEHEDFNRQRYGAAGAPGSAEPREKRNRDWRPGGDHKDPRARFDKEKRRRDKREQRAEREQHFDRARQAKQDGAKPPEAPPGERPNPPGDRPSQARPQGTERRPWSGKPKTDRAWSSKPPAGAPRGDRPWSNKPPTGAPRGDRPWRDKPPRRDGDRPWQAKPQGTERRPWSGKPKSDRAWSNKPPAGAPRGDRPWRDKPPRPDGDRPWQSKPDRGDRPPDRKPFAGKGRGRGKGPGTKE